MQDFKITPLSSIRDSLEVKSIRNECRSFMTNNNSKLSIMEQLNWYLRIYKQRNKNGEMFCYLIKDDQGALGYGLIRKTDDKFWLTGGLKKRMRGRGMGEELFTYLIKNTPGDLVWLEVLESNKVAMNLYKKLGFMKVGEKLTNDKKIIVMNLSK